MQIEKCSPPRNKALIFTEDDKFLVTVDAIIGNLVTNTISVQSVITPNAGWRSEILEGGDVIAVLDVSTIEQVEKDIDRVTKLVEDPKIILLVRGDLDPSKALASRVSAIVPMEQLEELLHCVARLVVSGMCVMPGPVIQPTEDQCYQVDKNDPDIERLRTLSYTESWVLLGLTEGLSNKHIARQIDISDNTVRVHIRNIFLKLGVQNRTQAALLATRFRYSGVLHEKANAAGDGGFYQFPKKG